MVKTKEATTEMVQRRHRANDVYVDVRAKYPDVKVDRIDVNGDIILSGTLTAKQRRQLSGNKGYELFEEKGKVPRLQVIGSPEPTNSLNKGGRK